MAREDLLRYAKYKGINLTEDNITCEGCKRFDYCFDKDERDEGIDHLACELFDL